jgi:hypothetical protein
LLTDDEYMKCSPSEGKLDVRFQGEITRGMSDHVPAIFDAGVFRPLEPVDWPNGTRAEVTLVGSHPLAPAKPWPTSDFEQTAGAFQGEAVERPTQCELPN